MIGFLTGMWGGGPSYYRLELPSSTLPNSVHLDDLGIEPDGSVVGKTFIPDPEAEGTFIGEASTPLDILITQRWMDSNAADLTRAARSAGQIIIADLDDHYWELPTSHPTIEATDPLANPLYNRDAYWDQLCASSAVICSTPELVRYVGDRADVPVYLFRNMIDLDLWTHQENSHSWHPRIGWTGGTAWRKNDLTATGGAVGQFVRDFDLEFVHIGYDPAHPQAAEHLGIDRTTFQIELCNFNLYPKAMEYAKFDIGIVPLEDVAFNRAKSCLKGLEYAACGIPFVASPLPEYERLGVGLLAKTPRDWERELDRLRDPDFRALVAEEAYLRVRQEDVQVRGHEYADLLAQIAD